MPRPPPASMIVRMFEICPSRIVFGRPSVQSSTSCTATRPPDFLRQSSCETIACRHSASMVRICACSLDGNASIIRSMVFGALFVCMVAKTSMPIAAQVSPSRIVSFSRISPISTISGSERIAPRSAVGNDSACRPTSRWTIVQFLFWCTNSIGSSIVMMCLLKFSLI